MIFDDFLDFLYLLLFIRDFFDLHKSPRESEMLEHTPKMQYSTHRDHTYNPYSQTFDPRGPEDGQNQEKSRNPHFRICYCFRYFFDLHKSPREPEMLEHTPKVQYSTHSDHTYNPYSQTFDPRGPEDGQNQEKSRKPLCYCLSVTFFTFTRAPESQKC